VKKKAWFIVNPKAGHGIRTPMRPLIEAVFDATGWDVVLAESLHPGHAHQLCAQAVADGAGIVVAVGGDGTVNEVAGALTRTSIPLGIVPTGSGNGLARHFGIPVDTGRALRIVHGGHAVVVDSLVVNGNRCMNVAGAGFDAFIASRFAEAPRRGFLTYLKLVMRHYFRYRPVTMRLRFDGRELPVEALLVDAANGSQFGNGACIAPGADPGDGRLDLVILRKIPWTHIPITVARLYSGRLDKSPFLQQFRTTAVSLHASSPVDLHLDGEPAAPVADIQIRLEAATHRMIVP